MPTRISYDESAIRSQLGLSQEVELTVLLPEELADATFPEKCVGVVLVSGKPVAGLKDCGSGLEAFPIVARPQTHSVAQAIGCVECAPTEFLWEGPFL